MQWSPEVTTGNLITMPVLALLDTKFALPANVAVAWHVFPALMQFPAYAIVTIPAAAGLTNAVAVNALPVYTKGPVPNDTELVVGALLIVVIALALLDT